jgi:ubiquinone/menaquinone biosynthesis C-methylase UbiE
MNQELIDQKKYWDKEVQTFDSIYSHGKSKFSNWLDKKFRWDMYARFNYTIENSKPISGKSFLDVGCGTGKYSIRFAKEGAYRVIGIDISDNMINICKERSVIENVNNQCEFYVGDLTNFDSNQKFDIVIGIGLFDYIRNPFEVIKKMHNVSSDRVIASFPRSGTLRALIRKIRLSLKGCPVYFYSEKELDKLLKNVGFKDYSTKVLGQLFCITAYVND